MPLTLIADSGASKTDWIVFDENRVLSRSTGPGMNPNTKSWIAIKNLLSQIAISTKSVKRVLFYGAGLGKEENRIMMAGLLQDRFPSAEAEAMTDILGSARACCGKAEGIVGILGTGSNSCYFDGKAIVKTIGGKGWKAGDEGGGADIGKHLLSDCFSSPDADNLRKQFITSFGKSPEEFQKEALENDNPNFALTGLAPFIRIHSGHILVKAMVESRIGLFFSETVLLHERVKEIPVHFTGSIAWNFREFVERICRKNSLRPGKFVSAPVDDLVTFHQENPG